jgi:hypothetical protein
MFLLSYFWHGIMLNDLRFISYPLPLFLAFAAIVYLLVGAVVAKAFSLKIFNKVSRNLLLKGLVVGSLCGVLFYIVTLVFGVSFTREINAGELMIDVTWHAIEEGIGGLCVGFVHMLVWDDSMIRAEDMD